MSGSASHQGFARANPRYVRDRARQVSKHPAPLVAAQRRRQRCRQPRRQPCPVRITGINASVHAYSGETQIPQCNTRVHMQTNSEEMRARLLGQFSVRLDGTVVTPTTNWQRTLLCLLAFPARHAVITSTLAAKPRVGRLPARLRRHASGIRLPSARQAGRLTRTMPRAGGISPGNGMVSSHEGCKLFAPTPCCT
jgi:hypothetical protein